MCDETPLRLIPLSSPLTMWESYFVGMMKLLAIGITVVSFSLSLSLSL
jgi:hypothetical protein